jgi:hypothetical protein
VWPTELVGIDLKILTMFLSLGENTLDIVPDIDCRDKKMYKIRISVNHKLAWIFHISKESRTVK